MKKKKLKVVVEVWGIEVEETQSYADYGSGWYKFEYSIQINGNKKKFGQIDSSWSSQRKRDISSTLKRGYAATLVIQNHF